VPTIDKVIDRPRAYLAETGVPLLAAGLGFFFLGGGVLIQQMFPKGSMTQESPKLISLGCVGAVLWAARNLKQRIVFPRGGYVEPRVRPAIRFMFAASVAVAAALGILAIAWPGHQPHLESKLIAPGGAIAFAILCLAAGWKQKSTPMMLFGVYMAGLAPLLWWMPVSNYERLSWLQVGAGAPQAVAGAVRLRNFLRANPTPVEPTNE
jgi:hypothetical protein